jgi:broad specificity phosphatase PhoE
VSVLEVRRHSHRKTGGGSELSQAGVDLARRCGVRLGPFTTVTTSVSPRARETAVAMGFAVDHEVVTLVQDPDLYEEHGSQWYTEPQPYAALARLLDARGPHWRYASSLAGLWRDLLTPLGRHDSVLFVGHSGDLEAALVATFPAADHASWGGLLGPCEGATLTFGGAPGRFTDLALVRLRS